LLVKMRHTVLCPSVWIIAAVIVPPHFVSTCMRIPRGSIGQNILRVFGPHSNLIPSVLLIQILPVYSFLILTVHISFFLSFFCTLLSISHFL
jgi:hypothetical protein